VESVTEEGRMASNSSEKRRGMPIRFRAVFIVLLLVPAAVLFMVWGNWLTGGTGPGGSVFGPAVAVLFLLTLANQGLKKHRWFRSLNSAELIVIYVMVAICAGMISSVWDWCGSLATVIVYPIWHATPENGWEHMMWPNLPLWLTVGERPLLEGFFLGDSSPYERNILLAWARPALWWTAWTTCLVWVTLCLNVIARRRWSQEERLPFPMTELPLRLSEGERGLFRMPLFWIAVVGSAAIGLWTTLEVFFPAIPVIPFRLNLEPLLSEEPWSALRCRVFSWYPWSVGLAYLMPVDMAFSLIVFNLIWRAEYVVSRILGWNIAAYGGFPYGEQQSIGAFLAIMGVVLWLDRRYLREVLRRVIGISSRLDDSGEAFGYRTAVLGAIGGVVFLLWFLARGGVSLAIAGSFLVLYFIMAMAMSRIRAQLGPPDHEMLGAMPTFMLTEFPGIRALGPRGASMLALLRPYMHEQRPNPTPTQLEALRMAHQRGFSQRAVVLIMMVMVPLSMLVYFWANLHIGYQRGLGAGSNWSMMFVSRSASAGLDEWLRAPSGPNWSKVEALGVGGVLTVALMALKLRWPGWPLHPIAFPLAFSYPIDAMMPAILITWLVKVLLLRYGGLRAHRQALPFFLGILAGSALTSLVSLIITRTFGLGIG
jgi:hypothetical protein